MDHHCRPWLINMAGADTKPPLDVQTANTNEICCIQVGAEVHADTIPLLFGAQQAAADGTASSLQPANEAAAAAAVSNAAAARHLPLWPLLMDPQTGS